MSGRGRGRGRGGGQRGGQSSNADAVAIDTLTRAAQDIQQMISNMSTDDKTRPSSNTSKNNSRGSKSLMDLSGQESNPPRGHPGRGRGRGRGRGGHQGRQDIRASPVNPPPYYPDRGHGPRGHHPRAHHHHPANRGAHQGPRSRTPPPSYNDSMEGNFNYPHPRPPPPLMPTPPYSKFPANFDHPEMKGSHHQSELRAGELVKTLALFEGQWATAETLSRQVQFSEGEIMSLIQSRKDLFSFMNDGKSITVELVPKIKLCKEYMSDGGCTAKGSCYALHLCNNFIMDHCTIHPCMFGHKFDTNHNTSILSKHYLDLIDRRVLFTIIKKVCKGNASPRLCSFHNTKDGCRKKDRCDYFHICKEYLANGGKCPNNDCQYNHQLNNKHCRNLMIQHGLSVNESPRDLILNLQSTLLTGEHQASANKNRHTGEGSENQKHERKERYDRKDKIDQPAASSSGTIKTTDVCGDVQIPEICIYSINNKCFNDKKGCKYLHAKSLFHWQVEKKKKWYNLRIFQSKCLETAYRDVSNNEVNLPRLDPSKVEGQDKTMLDIIGTHSWNADFTLMIVSNKTGAKLKIRRISTASSAVSKLPQATVYEWYFQDEKDKWIPYGHIDSLGKQEFVCHITSEDIEKQYMADSSTPMAISSAQYKYQLDFIQMTQTNLSTGKVRVVRRRPSRLSYQRAAGSGNSGDGGSLPSTWLPMRSEQTHLLVPLDTNSNEYVDVVSRVRLTLPNVTIHSVKRLQNQYLWQLMQYKKGDLSSRYDKIEMNIQKLFHGTNSDFIDGICKENIDFRKCFNDNQHYGKGTYFSNSCATACKLCKPDVSGRTFLVLAEVIIGMVTVGYPGLSRPPSNPATGALFDTTVDSIQAPTVFVKYDKEEYYPEYVVELY